MDDFVIGVFTFAVHGNNICKGNALKSRIPNADF